MKDETVLAIEAVEGIFPASIRGCRCILLDELNPDGRYLVLSGYSNIIGSEVQGYTGRVLQTSWRSLTYNKFSSAAASIPEGYCLVELPSKKGHCLAAKELWISQS